MFYTLNALIIKAVQGKEPNMKKVIRLTANDIKEYHVVESNEEAIKLFADFAKKVLKEYNYPTFKVEFDVADPIAFLYKGK